MNVLIEKWKGLPTAGRWVTAVIAAIVAGGLLFAAGYGVGYALGAVL